MKCYILYKIFQSFVRDPENTTFGIIWLIGVAIDAAIISLIIAAIARLVDKNNDFGEWFTTGFVVVCIIEIIANFLLMFI